MSVFSNIFNKSKEGVSEVNNTTNPEMYDDELKLLSALNDLQDACIKYQKYKKIIKNKETCNMALVNLDDISGHAVCSRIPSESIVGIIETMNADLLEKIMYIRHARIEEIVKRIKYLHFPNEDTEDLEDDSNDSIDTE